MYFLRVLLSGVLFVIVDLTSNRPQNSFFYTKHYMLAPKLPLRHFLDDFDIYPITPHISTCAYTGVSTFFIEIFSRQMHPYKPQCIFSIEFL